MTSQTHPNEYPVAGDDGNEGMQLTTEGTLVVLKFAKPVKAIHMGATTAAEIAAGLIEAARQVNPNVKVPLPSYQLIENGTAIQCFHCGAVSHSRTDVAMRYCGRCHKFLESR